MSYDSAGKPLHERLDISTTIKYYSKVLNETQGIELLGFQEGIRPFSQGQRISKLYHYDPDQKRLLTESEVVQWITTILKDLNICGEYLLRYRDREFARGWALWARVTLAKSYEWVEPLWKRGKELQFLTLSQDTFLDIYSEEIYYEAMLHKVMSEQT